VTAARDHDRNLADAAALSSLYTAKGDAGRRLTLWQAWDASLPGNPFIRTQLERAIGE
jgi:hypothetical protein